MTRQEANFKILNILRVNYPVFGEFYEHLKTLIEVHKDQRFGQIVCKYVCGDYRSTIVSLFTKIVMETLFPGNPDPFFEESVDTLKRLTNGLKK